MGCQRPSRFWGLGCPKIYHEAEDTLEIILVFDEARCHIGNDLAGKTLKPPPFCMGSRPFIAVPFL
ncbi:hypothetical protein, partial [Thiolapillus sp.]